MWGAACTSADVESADPAGSTSAPAVSAAAENAADPWVAIVGPLLVGVSSGDPDAGALQAGVGGTVDLRGDCVIMVAAGTETIPTWPAGTTWDAETREIVFRDGQRLAMGGRVDGGGGEARLDRVDFRDQAVADFVNDCDTVADSVTSFNVEEPVRVS